MAAAGTVAEAIGGEGTGGVVVKEAVGAGAEGKLGEGVAVGAEGKKGEAETKTKKKGKNPLFTPSQKLAEIDRLRAQNLIVSDGRKGRKKQDE
jgi:hypothetical protein